MPHKVHRFLIRIRVDLFEQVRESSIVNHRSLNSEINFRLAHSLSQGLELEGSDFQPADPVDEPPSQTLVEAELTALIERLSPTRQAALLAFLSAD